MSAIPSSALPLAAALIALTAAVRAQDQPLYLDSRQPVAARVEDLLARMTLKEKVGQMNMPCVYLDALGKDIESKRTALKRFTEGTYTSEIGPGGGFFTASNVID